MHPSRSPAARVGFDEFEDALFAGFARVACGVGVQVVGIDLELHGADGPERAGFDDGHVVGRRNRRAADIASGRPAHVGYSGPDAVADDLHQSLFLHLLGQREGVAAAHADRFGPADCTGRVDRPVDRAHANAQFGEAGGHAAFVFGVGECHGGIGHERYFTDIVEETPDFGQRIAQVLLAGVGRIGNQKKFHKAVVLNPLILKLC